MCIPPPTCPKPSSSGTMDSFVSKEGVTKCRKTMDIETNHVTSILQIFLQIKCQYTSKMCIIFHFPDFEFCVFGWYHEKLRKLSWKSHGKII